MAEKSKKAPFKGKVYAPAKATKLQNEPMAKIKIPKMHVNAFAPQLKAMIEQCLDENPKAQFVRGTLNVY